MVRRTAFLSGLILGSGVCAWLLGAALVYLFTGKALSLQKSPKGFKLRLNDLTLHEVLPREEGM